MRNSPPMCNKDNQQFHPSLKDVVPLLRLDEKKIRKGKPDGLPYQGSKKKVAKKVAKKATKKVAKKVAKKKVAKKAPKKAAKKATKKRK